MAGLLSGKMVLDRIAVLFKVGDQISRAGVKDGMPVCYIDESEWGLPLETIMSNFSTRVFASVQIDRRLLNFIKNSLLPTHQVNADGGIIMPNDFRARKHSINFSNLQVLTRIPDLESKLRGADSVPLINGTGLSESLFRDTTLVDYTIPRVDRNLVSFGSFTVGAAKDYTTFASATADIANLTANLTFSQETDVIETATSMPTENYGGFTLKYTNSSSHAGSPISGNLIEWNVNSELFNCQGSNGTIEIEKLRIKLIAALTGAKNCLLHSSAGSMNTIIHDCMVDHNGGRGRSYAANTSGGGIAKAFNIVAFDNITDDMFFIVTGSITLENCTAFSGATGVNCNSSTGLVRNVASFDNTIDFANIGSATGRNNCSSDTTATDGNWSVGTGNLISKTSTVSFASTDDTVVRFLDLKTGSPILNTGNTTLLTENTVGIRLRVRPNASTNVSIGASEAGIPGSPTNLSADTVSNNKINLFWNAPVDDGGFPISGYKLERAETRVGTFSIFVADTGNTITFKEDSGLTSEKEFNYRVSTINEIGTGPTSVTNFAITLPAQIIASTIQLEADIAGLQTSVNTLTNSVNALDLAAVKSSLDNIKKVASRKADISSLRQEVEDIRTLIEDEQKILMPLLQQRSF